MGYFLIIILGVMLDKILGSNIIRNVIIYFFISNEGISILENWALMGLPIPKKLRDTLLELRKRSDTKDE